MAPVQQKDAKMSAGQKQQLSNGKRPDIIGDANVAVPRLTPEQNAQGQSDLYKSKWATPVDEYQTAWEKILAGKGGPSASQITQAAVPAATSGAKQQPPTSTDKPTAGKQESKGKQRATTQQPSTSPQKIDRADDGHNKPSSQKGSSGKTLSANPPKPASTDKKNMAVGEGPSDSRRPPPVTSQQSQPATSLPPASENDNDNDAGSDAAKKRRRRGRRGKGGNKDKDNEAAASAIAPQTSGQSTSQPSPAKGNGPKESAAGGADKKTSKPSTTTASAPPKTPAAQSSSAGAARKAADSKLAQPALALPPAQPKQLQQPQQKQQQSQQQKLQQQGGVRGNGQQAPQHPGAAKGSLATPPPPPPSTTAATNAASKPKSAPANVPRANETTGNDRKVAGTPATQQRPAVQAPRFGPSAPAGGAATTGVAARSMAVQRPATGPVGFAVTAQKAPVQLGWSPNMMGDSRARRSGVMPRLAPGWEGYQDRINVSGAIQDIYLYAGDRLDVEKFNAYVASPCHSVEAKVNCLKDIVVTMDRVVSEKHASAMSIKAERDAFRDDYDRAKAQADEYAERLAAEQLQREQLEEQIVSLRHSVAGLRKEVVTKESHLDSAEVEILRLKDDLAANHSLLDKAVSKQAAQAAETASHQEQVASLHGEVEKLSGELSGLRAKFTLADSERKALAEEIAKSPLQSENEHLRSQLSEVRDQLDSANQIRNDLEAERAAHICCQPVESGNPTSATLSMELEGWGVGQDSRSQTDEEDGRQTRSRQPSPPASSASLYGGGNTVSTSTQTDEVEVIETSTQTEEAVVSQLEASTQTVCTEVVTASTQTVSVEVSTSEASAQTALTGDVLSPAEVEVRVAGVCQKARTKDAQVQTAMVVEVPRGRVASLRFLLALLLLAWAMIMLWSRYSEISAWEAANDTSRATVAGIRSQQAVEEVVHQQFPPISKGLGVFDGIQISCFLPFFSFSQRIFTVGRLSLLRDRVDAHDTIVVTSSSALSFLDLLSNCTSCPAAPLADA
ncbi:hypothetical protein TRV_05035 [Trichophyton verrucosum HKI 0517]|uniref:Uncharacterized protein n=1 Tax=Trichophyton verrucosum (strain HKI 0517) TaxID=663202 RepID=D4DD28_TRIVH|nr:uncharacterized protein TRV_05035 [Trichophyton verrucosum HKI 0517]EFE40239.1 hypothetical protein TRV_05035 [Trichophyton verrucosum HKI 0517]